MQSRCVTHPDAPCAGTLRQFASRSSVRPAAESASAKWAASVEVPAPLPGETAATMAGHGTCPEAPSRIASRSIAFVTCGDDWRYAAWRRPEESFRLLHFREESSGTHSVGRNPLTFRKSSADLRTSSVAKRQIVWPAPKISPAVAAKPITANVIGQRRLVGGTAWVI